MKKTAPKKSAASKSKSAGKAKPAAASANGKPAMKNNGNSQTGNKGMQSLEALKRAFLIGLGATVFTAEKLRDAVKDMVDEMVERGDIKPDEAKKFAEDLRDRFMTEKDHFESTVRKTMDGVMKKTMSTLAAMAEPSAKPAAKKPAAKKPAAKKPAAKKPAAKKPAAKKPAAKKPATKKPVAATAKAATAKKPAAAKKATPAKKASTAKKPAAKAKPVTATAKKPAIAKKAAKPVAKKAGTKK